MLTYAVLAAEVRVSILYSGSELAGSKLLHQQRVLGLGLHGASPSANFRLVRLMDRLEDASLVGSQCPTALEY